MLFTTWLPYVLATYVLFVAILCRLTAQLSHTQYNMCTQSPGAHIQGQREASGLLCHHTAPLAHHLEHFWFWSFVLEQEKRWQLTWMGTNILPKLLPHNKIQLKKVPTMFTKVATLYEKEKACNTQKSSTLSSKQITKWFLFLSLSVILKNVNLWT